MKRVGKMLVAAFAAACGPSAPPAPAPPSTTPPPPPATSAVPASKEEACAPSRYVAEPAWSGKAVSLPPVPAMPDRPKKTGDAFSVFGAIHALRSRFDSAEVTKQSITIVGLIVDTNVTRAPACALHPSGKADPPNCVSEVPSFAIADDKDAMSPRIRVLGWAHNFAAVFDAKNLYAKGKPAQPYVDELWAVQVPYPLPAVGTKVKVTGRYGFSFTKGASGVELDSDGGILTYEKMEVVP